MESEEAVPFLEVSRLDPQVEKALAEVFPSDDPLDAPDFDPVVYINNVFPSEQSLTNLDDFVAKLKTKIKKIDDEVAAKIRAQTKAVQEGRRALSDTQAGIQELFEKVRDIRTKADVSEQMVREITRDIKSLDYAKRHLTSSILTLNHLHMLVGGVESLTVMTKKRQYREVANLLGALLTVMEHFSKHMEVERVKDLHQKIETIKSDLGKQITEEFREAFRNPTPDRARCDARTLNEGCAVLDVIDKKYKETLVVWFVALQLKDYTDSFSPNQIQRGQPVDNAWVDKIDRRYAWFKRTLAAYIENTSDIFPESWKMPELIAVRFCEVTSNELTRIMRERVAELDVKLFLFSLQKTTQFESWLNQRFHVPTEEEVETERNPDDPEPVDEAGLTDAEIIRRKYLKHKRDKERAAKQEIKAAAPPKPPSNRVRFDKTISKIFEGFMDVYVQAQDKALGDMMDQFIAQFKESLPVPNRDTEEEPKLMRSCGDLFLFFRNGIVQCKELMATKAMYDLYVVFKKNLRLYYQRVLCAHLPRYNSIQAILYKDAEVRLTTEEQYVTCCILNTSEYCLDTTKQLEEKLKSVVDPSQVASINLNDEQDLYNELISNCVQLLMRSLESQLEPSLTAMTKMKWDGFEEVGDTSPYVLQMGRQITMTVPLIRANLSSSRKYFTNFCLKFANSFIPRVRNAMYKCRGISSIGAEQLLLDMQSIKILLQNMPSVGAAVARNPPANYTRFVNTSMGKCEIFVKTLMAPHDSPKEFVDNYLQRIGNEEGLAGFQRILEMKGLKKADQQPLLDVFKEATQQTASSRPTDTSGEILEKVASRVGGEATTKRFSLLASDLHLKNVQKWLRQKKPE
eukprot:m.149724 g.149724  ORF g.149724 m.149724 type:complete len:855 (+) comp16865_c0_seq1:404-2968(+)